MIAAWLALAWAADAPDEPGQPIPDRPFDVSHLDLSVRLDLDRGSLTGEVALDATRRSAGPLWLHQRGLDIQQVEVNDRAVSFRTRRDRLEVPVPADADRVTVRVVYAAEPRAGLHFRGLDDAPKGEARLVYSQGEDEDHRHWFPSWDHPSDRFTVSMHIEVPTGVGAWGIGTAEGTTSLDDGWVRHDYRLDRPIPNYLVALAAGDYTEHVTREGSVPLSVLVPGGQPVAAWTDAAAPTERVVTWLEEVLDEPYPYPVYRTIGVTRFLYGGMENPGFVTLTDGVRADAPGDDPRRGEAVVAHEAAHQWFGDLVTTYGWRHMWLNEGFATYWTARWMGHTYGDAAFAETVRRWHERALASDAPMAPRGATHQGRDFAKAYTQGGAFLHFLAGVLGRDGLDRGIRAYLDRHRDQFVESADLRRVLEDDSGRSLGPWFDAFVHHPGHARLSSSWAWSDGAVEITLEQPNGPDDRPPVLLPVDVAVSAADGQIHRRTLRVVGGSTRWLLELEEEPRWVSVDPRGHLLAHVHRAQPPHAWARQAQEAPDAFARLEALHQLGESADDETTLAVLTETLADREGPAAERRAAATALGEVPAAAAARALHQAVDDTDVRVVRAALDALAKHHDHASRDELAAFARRRRSELHARALDTLSRLDATRAAPLAVQWLRQRDTSRDARFHGRAMDALARTHDPVHLRQIVPFLAPRTPYWTLSAGLLAAGRLAKGLDDDDPRRVEVVERALGLLTSRDHRVVQRSLHVLSMVGTSRTADRLEDRARTLPDWEGLPHQARTVAAALRTPRKDGPERGPDLDELQAELAALAERVERLERY